MAAARFFNCAARHVTDKIIATYKAGEPKPDVTAEPASGANEPAFRIATGGRIDRSRPLVFTFDGRWTTRALPATRWPPRCSPTACISSAARSSIIGRAASLSAGAEEPNALVTSSAAPGVSTPNLRATQIELYDGPRAESQNRWPSLAFDVGAVNDLCFAAVPAGFYYKTFMGPRLGLEERL